MFNIRFDAEYKVKPAYLQNVYFTVILFSGLISFGLYGSLRPCNPFDVRIAAILSTLIFIIVFSIYLRHFFRNSVFLTMTPEKIIGYNHFKKYKGEIRWDEIVEMISTGGTYYILLKDKNGKKLLTGAPLADFKTITFKDDNDNDVIEKTDYSNYEVVLNEMILRAVNCRKIDFRTIRKKFPRISVYEKNI